MTTSELRETLTEQKALHKVSLARADAACTRITEILNGIDDAQLDKLQTSCNIDLSILRTMDLERMKSDKEYLNSVQIMLSTGIHQLQKYIEGCLNV